MIKVAVDAMGGDNSPQVVLDGIVRALGEDSDFQVIVTGDAQVVEPFAGQVGSRVVAHPTTQVIAMDEHPAQAVKEKTDSSIVVGCRLVKEQQAQGFFSAGSTGACMTASTLVIGRIKGVLRPAIATVIPAPKGNVVLLDVGANADVKASYLLQFAQMAKAYCQATLDIAEPRVGLLNIGSESTKGNTLALETYELLAKEVIGFAGNAEGDDIFKGGFDIIVTDGFTGNVTLKTLEGTVSALFRQIKGVLTTSTGGKLAGLLVKAQLGELKDSLSADKIGGAPLLGVNGVSIIGHGSSNAQAIANGIHQCVKAIRNDLVGTITAEVVRSQQSKED